MPAPRSCARPISAQEDLGGRLCVRQRAVARPHRGAEELRQGAQAARGDPPREQPSRQPDRVDDRRGEPSALDQLDLAVEEADVEAGVVRDEDRRPTRSRGSAGPPRRATARPQVAVLDPGQRGDDRGKRDSGVDERLERARVRQPVDAHRADLADRGAAGPQTGRLQVDDDVARRLERQRSRRVVRRARPPTRATRAARRPRRRRRAGSAQGPPGAKASANSARAASSAGTGPRRSSTRSTSRSAASKVSCASIRTYVRIDAPAGTRDGGRSCGPRLELEGRDGGYCGGLASAGCRRRTSEHVAAGIVTFSPVRGLTPCRSSRCCGENLPKPVNDTCSPPLSASVIESRNASTAFAASRFESPLFVCHLVDELGLCHCPLLPSRSLPGEPARTLTATP